MSRWARLPAWVLAALAVPALAAAPAQPGSRANIMPSTTAPTTSDTGAVATQAPATDAASRPVTLATIVVKGSTQDAVLKTRQWLTPGTVSIVPGKTFQQRSVSNLADALRYVPGVFIQSNTGGDDGVISIRGSNLTALSYAKSGVTLFQDGLPVTTADGANHNRLVDPLTAHAVVVASGPNALTYGASDLGGAIDFISRTARNSDPNQVYLLGGNHGFGEGRVSGGGASGNFDGMATLAYKDFSGFQDHSRERRASFDGNAGWQVSDNFALRLFATAIDSHQQLAGSLTRKEFNADPRQADPAYALGNHQLNVKTARLAAKGAWTINEKSWLEFGLFHEVQSLYHPIVDVFDFSSIPPVDFFSLLIDTTQRTTGGMLRYHFRQDDHDLVAGIDLARTVDVGANYENDHGQRGAKTDDVNQHADDLTLFALDRWGFAPRWTFVYGAQGVVTDRNVEDISVADGRVRDQRHTYASLNPRLGLIYALSTNTEVFASISRVYQAPTNFDLDNDVRKNDSVLAATRGISYEVGTRGQGTFRSGDGSWHWSLALYTSRLRNEILSVEDPSQPGNMLSTNYPRTVHTGLEALWSASVRLGGGPWRIEPLVSASWNDFCFDHDGNFGNNRLPMAPRYQVHGEILLRDSATGFYAGPTFDAAGVRYADMANTYRVGGYGLVGLRAGIQRRAWNLFVEAQNLANRKFVNTVSVLTLADPDARVLNAGAPRSVYVGLTLRY